MLLHDLRVHFLWLWVGGAVYLLGIVPIWGRCTYKNRFFTRFIGTFLMSDLFLTAGVPIRISFFSGL